MAELKRVLSSKAILLITINSIIGSGLFILPGIAAQKAGPASIISWVILSLIALYTAICFSELVSMFPTSGGIYEYSKEAYGTFPSFMIGWIAWIVGNITTAMLIIGGVQYLVEIINISGVSAVSLFFIKLGICIILLLSFNYLTFRGIKTSAGMLIFFAVITLLVIIVLIATSVVDVHALLDGNIMTHFEISNLTPFFTGQGLFDNALIIITTLFVISEAFFGIESVCFLAGETKDPEKVLPKALIWATVVITILTLVLVVVSLGSINWHDFAASDAPFATLASKTMGDYGMTAIAFGTFVVIIGAAAGWIVTTPRLILTLAEDKLFPTSFARIHPRFNSPHNAIIFQTFFTGFLIGVGLLNENSYELLLELLIPLVLLMMSAVLLVVPVLRIRKPHHERPFRAPFIWVGVPLLVIINISLVFAWLYHDPHAAFDILKLGFALIFFGVPIFGLLILYYDPDIIVKLNNAFAYLNLMFERALLPRKIVRSIDDHLGDLRGKKVLEFGCGVGSLTKELVKKVGETGHVYATDLSYNSVRIADRRLARAGHSNVTFIHDIHQVNRVHHAIPKVDAVVSFGMLGYIQDIKKVLRELASILPDGGRIIFVDYVDLFKVIPNVSWLSDEHKLVKVFRECGFSVKTRKHETSMWNYLFVYGIRTDHDVPFI